MKSSNRNTKKGSLIRPSPNEEAAIVQREQERRKKIRLQQVREQEKAFAFKIRQNIKNKKDNELKNLSEQLKEQWTEKQKTELNSLEKKYQKTLDKLGDGHTAAMADQDTMKKDGRVLSKEDRQRAIERHNQAVIQLNLERARNQQAENDRSAAREKAMEAERARAALIASLSPSRDLIKEFELKEEQKYNPKSAEDFKSTRYHLQQPVVQVERMSKEQQVDARAAAAKEENKIHGMREEIQRSEAEQAEKARLRHRHALAQLKIEEDRKKLMDDLSELERLDRQRRQDAVARIPVRIFQPPHKRLEDEEERQRDLEQAFEDMYMMQTGYTGDLTIALEPSTDPMTIPEELQPQVPDVQPEKLPATVIPSVTIPQDQESVDGSKTSEETEEMKNVLVEQKEEEEEERMRKSAPAKGEDAVKRLLLRIQRQREQGKKMKDQVTTDQQPNQPSRTAARVTRSRVNILTPLPEEEEPSRADDDTSSTAPPVSRPTTVYHDVPRSVPSDSSQPLHTSLHPDEPLRDEDTSSTLPPSPHPTTKTDHDVPRSADSSQPLRTLLHPYEAAQQVRMIGPQRPEDETPSSESDESVPEYVTSQQQSELQEQERLKLKLQEQRRIQERLEEQLNQYHRQFQKISSEIPKGPYGTRNEPSPHSGARIIHESHGPGPFEEPDSFDQINVPSRHIRDEDGQGDHLISSESRQEEGSSTSRTSGTISLEEQTPDEEGISESSRSMSDYGTAGASGTLPPRDSLESSTRISLEDSTVRPPREHDTSSSDESHGLSSTDYMFQRGTALSQARDQASGFLPLEWQRDSRVGPWKPSGLAPKVQDYPLKAHHETTGESVPPESSNESGERLESEDLTSSSDSSNDVPHDQLLDLLRRKNIQSFGQNDSGFVPTLPLSSLGPARTTTVLDSETSHQKGSYSMLPKSWSQADRFLPTSSYSGDSKLSTGAPSLGVRQEIVPSRTIDTAPASASYSRLLDGSPNYLDEYRRKWEEEKKLIENQRQLIRQKQEHQLRRMRYYQDILERYEGKSPTSLDVKPSESIRPRAVATDVATRTSSELTNVLNDSFKSHSDLSQRKAALASANKENESFYANSVLRVPPLTGLKGSSSSSDNSAFTRRSYPWSSSSSSHSGKKLLATKDLQAGTETRKSTSTSDFSFPSSGTEYHSLPISLEVSANMGPGNGSRSSITTLSELNEIMRKFTSSSENESAKDLASGVEKVSGKGNWAEYLSESRTPEDDPSTKYTLPSYEPQMHASLFTGIEDNHTNGDENSSRQWYRPVKPSSQSVGSLGPVHEDDSPSSGNLESLDGGERFEGCSISSNRPVGSLGSPTEFISSNVRREEYFDDRGIQLPPRPTTQSIESLGTPNEFISSNVRREEYFDDRGIQLPPRPTTQSIEPLGTPNEFISSNVRREEYFDDRCIQLPPRPTTQSIEPLGTPNEFISSIVRREEYFDDRCIQLPPRPTTQSIEPLGTPNEFISSIVRREEYFDDRGIQLPPRPTTQSIEPLGTPNEFISSNVRREQLFDGGTHIGGSIQIPPPTVHSIDLVEPADNVSTDTSDLEHQGPGTQQWYLPPKSSTQSMGSFGVPPPSNDISSSSTSNLQLPDRALESSESRSQVPQWFIPPKSSLQSVGSPGDFSEGSSPDSSSLKNLDNVFRTLQRPTELEKWYSPMLSHDSEKGESSPERSLSFNKGDVKKQTTATFSSSYTPAFIKTTLGARVMGERSRISTLNDSTTSPEFTGNEGNGTRGGNTSMGEVLFSPSSEHKGNGILYLGPLDQKMEKYQHPLISSGSLEFDEIMSQSKSSTKQNSEAREKSDEEAPGRTGNEPGNQTTEAETTVESTGSEMSQHVVSTNTQATDVENFSYEDKHFGTDGSSTTGLQDAFARRKQDFIKKSLARVERAKAKRFEETPRVFVKKRVKPDKPVSKPDKPIKLDKPVQPPKPGKKSKKTKK